jgi:hypothetical protein
MTDDLRTRVARAIFSSRSHIDLWDIMQMDRGDALKATDAAIAIVREECAKVAERCRDDFASEQYATNQPLSSFSERHACKVVASAIRKLGE